MKIIEEKSTQTLWIISLPSASRAIAKPLANVAFAIPNKAINTNEDRHNKHLKLKIRHQYGNLTNLSTENGNQTMKTAALTKSDNVYKQRDTLILGKGFLKYCKITQNYSNTMDFLRTINANSPSRWQSRECKQFQSAIFQGNARTACKCVTSLLVLLVPSWYI